MPNISAASPNDQINQMRAYLYSFAQELQWALNTVESGSSDTSAEVTAKAAAGGETGSQYDSVQIFNEIKSLIIKSADIVEAYYDQIENMIDLSGRYVAQSVYGTFEEYVRQTISGDSRLIQQNLESYQKLSGLVNGMAEKILSNEAYIKYGAVGTTLDDTGLAEENAPGIEIGDYARMEDGETIVTNRRYARFTAYGLELFGDSIEAAPIAYIKQRKLYITNAEITNTLRVGGYMISRADGLSFDWVGVD